MTGEGKVLLNRITERRNLLTDEIIQKATKTELPYQPRRGATPRHLALTGHGESILLAWENGDAVRFDARDMSSPVVAEEIDLVPEPNAALTAVELLIGRRSLLVGDSSGRVASWFGVRSDDGRTSDGIKMTRAHELVGNGSAVTSLAASSRTRLALAGYTDGQVRLFQVTNAETMIESAVNDSAVTAVAIGPKDDRLYAFTKQKLWAADLDPKYPEVSFSSLFRPVWYEDYPRPEHVWQSTGGTSDFEPKLGLWPLIFGTLKATFYSMLFGAPLALLAAIYTSEFMHPRWRDRVKPSIELMASLPSVVLGFLAGNVLAPMVEGIVPAPADDFCGRAGGDLVRRVSVAASAAAASAAHATLAVSADRSGRRSARHGDARGPWVRRSSGGCSRATSCAGWMARSAAVSAAGC